jgi:hypothetical protein
VLEAAIEIQDEKAECDRQSPIALSSQNFQDSQLRHPVHTVHSTLGAILTDFAALRLFGH